MDLHNAYCTYGTCSQHRNRIIQQCIAGTAATLHSRYAQNVDMMHPEASAHLCKRTRMHIREKQAGSR